MLTQAHLCRQTHSALARHEQCGVAACEWAPQKQTRSCRFFSDFDPCFVKRQLVAAPHLVYVAFPLDSSSKGNPAPPCTLFKLPFFLQPRVVKYKRIYKQRFLKQTCSTNSDLCVCFSLSLNMKLSKEHHSTISICEEQYGINRV